MNSANPTFSPETLEYMAKILKAISHPVKLEILQVLANEEPLDVSSICDQIGASCEMSMMSHHLNKLKDNGIVSSDKVGKQVFYSIENRQILRIFNCISDCDLF